VADLTIASALVNPLKFLLDEPMRATFPSIERWFNVISSADQFI